MSALTAVSCVIPVANLKAAPFSLDWGSSVYAKVTATNSYGNSLESDAGNGAVITTTPDAPTNVAEVYEQRTKSTLGLSWVAPVFTGGAVIEDYRVSYAEQGQAFSVLASGVTDTAYLATDLTFGVTYEFKVESRNSYGFSAFSETLTLLCAFKPDPPLTASTANTDALVTIAWGEPVANGSPITAYKILVEEKGTGVFTQESVDCDGTSADVVSSRQCTIQLATLRAAPYSLVKDDSVRVKVISVNVYGDSVESVVGSGAVIQLVPDAPVSLANDPAVTTDTQIRFTWSAGASDGGNAVIDYAVYYDQGTDSFALLDGAVTDQFYLTTVTLTPGTTYKFRVTARN